MSLVPGDRVIFRKEATLVEYLGHGFYRIEYKHERLDDERRQTLAHVDDLIVLQRTHPIDTATENLD